MSKSKEYSNGALTVVWKPDLCIHSAICVKGLGEVFQPREKPWIKIEAATNEAIINQVKVCPSGALSYYLNNEKEATLEKSNEEIIKIDVRENGPLVVHGNCSVTLTNGNVELRERITTFCRCGMSSNKPFCDGAHRGAAFKG